MSMMDYVIRGMDRFKLKLFYTLRAAQKPGGT
jgi:hypothetical protein